MNATHDHDPHSHSHSHPAGSDPAGSHPAHSFFGRLVPHSHDAADSIDDVLEASVEGVRAVKTSLFILLGTTVLQFAIVIVSSSVALLADSIHNFSDALTAVPLWIAFVLGRRAATRTYPYGFGRAEDLAGLFIVAVVALSAVVAAWQSIARLVHPEAVHNLWWIAAAGLVGFVGNEAVAVYRIRVGRRIGSAALVADGVHARLDGFTSLAVVLGAVGVMLGIPLADPVVGLLISVTIIVLLWGTVRSVGRRLMDGIEPELMDRAEAALASTPGVLGVNSLQLRWVGHRLRGSTTIVLADLPLSKSDAIVHDVHHRLSHALPNLDELTVGVTASATVAEPHTHH